jgi:cytoskeletal protein CcmA (bactofilin family)
MFFKKSKSETETSSSTLDPSYIARDTSFEGNIICDGEIHIDGMVRGTVRAQTCLIDAHGEILGELTAQHIFIRGRMIGPVTGTHVNIQAGAHVEGNVTNETISIENGAYVFGSMRQGGLNQPPIEAEPVPAKHEPFKAMTASPLAEDVVDNVRPLKTAKP